MLAGCQGVIAYLDDILVYGATEEEHDERLRAVLEWIRAVGMIVLK